MPWVQVPSPRPAQNRLFTSNGVDRRFSLCSKMLKYA
nr:MAG TPA: hypothetical protein [Caudoviricetes sp.]